MLSLDRVYIKSSLVLTKPLVLSGNVRIDLEAGAVLTLAAQPVLPNKQVGRLSSAKAGLASCLSS